MYRAQEDEGFQRFLDRASSHPLLSAREERELAYRIQKGDRRAKQRLVECNIRLVLSIAQHFQNRGLAKPDLIQEGIIGLHTAAEKFKPELGYKFSTYATWWVRKSMQQGLASAGADTIRLPPAVRQRRGLARSILSKDPGLTLQEVADKMEITVESLLEALRAAEVVVSVDEHLGDGDSATVLDTISDPHTDDPFDVVRDDFDNPFLLQVVDELPRLQRSVVRLRFGLIPGRPPMSIAAIASQMHKPTHTIQLAQRRALDKLKARLKELDG